MNLSASRRILSLSGFGLLAMGLLWAGGKTVASQKSKPSAEESTPATRLSSTTADISSINSRSGVSEEQMRRLARKAVARRAADFDEEFEVLAALDLL